MDFTALFLESLGSLTINKLRTGLAMLGIVIGIGSVMTLVSLGEASQKSIQSSIQSLGAKLLTVSPTQQTAGGVRGAGSDATLTNEDAKAIQGSAQITTVASVSPEVDNRAQITRGKNNTSIRINSVTASYAQVHKISIDSG